MSSIVWSSCNWCILDEHSVFRELRVMERKRAGVLIHTHISTGIKQGAAVDKRDEDMRTLPKHGFHGRIFFASHCLSSQ